MIKLMLVDDHDLVRSGIRRLLEDTKNFEIVAEAKSGEEALQKIRETEPQVVLMDLNMPGMGGLDATRKLLIYKPDLKIIAVSMHQDDLYPQRVLKAGAVGYLTKGAPVDEIVHAIKEVMVNHRYVTPEIAQSLALSNFDDKNDSPFDSLSQRELQVLTLIMDGHKVGDISVQLSLSPKTVSTYRHRLYEKLGVTNDIELARLAISFGIIENTPLKP